MAATFWGSRKYTKVRNQLRVTGQWLMTDSLRRKAQMGAVCQFPGCENSHHGPFQEASCWSLDTPVPAQH